MKAHRTLSQAYPALVSEWSEKNFPFLPDDEHEDSYSKVWWKCPVCGHEWQAAVRSRAMRGNGCPCCAGKVIKESVNDLASLRPDIAAEWSDKNLPLTPDQVTQWSSRSVWWKGECGHEWKTTIGNRCKGNPCPICSKEPLIPGVNDLLTTHPDIAAEWSGRNAFSPKDIRASYSKQVWWKCPKCGNEYPAQPVTRIRQPERLCPYCRGRTKERTPTGPSPPVRSSEEKDGDKQ